jgi:hypothetical protein
MRWDNHTKQSPTERVRAAKESNKALYHQRKAAGLCAHCGDRPPYPDFVSCLECRREFRTYQQRYTFKLRAMKQQGLEILRCPCRKRAMVLCIQCQAPLCDTCYDLGEGRCSLCLDGAHSAMEDA